MTSQNPIPSDDFIEEYLREPLTPIKKEELAQMREEWEQARKDALEHKKNNEYWKFLVADWFEQGCGRTFFLMMTQGTPEGRDYDRDGENPYTPINTQEERAIRKFKEVFGEYFTQDLHFVTREEFFTKYAQYLPPRLFELKDELCNIDYHSKLHFNFS
jgi:hypothetical protein